MDIRKGHGCLACKTQCLPQVAQGRVGQGRPYVLPATLINREHLAQLNVLGLDPTSILFTCPACMRGPLWRRRRSEASVLCQHALSCARCFKYVGTLGSYVQPTSHICVPYSCLLDCIALSVYAPLHVSDMCMPPVPGMHCGSGCEAAACLTSYTPVSLECSRHAHNHTRAIT